MEIRRGMGFHQCTHLHQLGELEKYACPLMYLQFYRIVGRVCRSRYCARAENLGLCIKITISQKLQYFVPIWVNLAQDDSRSHLEVNLISQFRAETDF